MNSVDYRKNISVPEKERGPKYNWQHLVFVTKYRYKMFKNSKTVEVIKRAINDAAARKNITIRELSFGEDYAHIHIEIDLRSTLSVASAAQLLKGYSSYLVFKEIPNHRLRYPQGHFWGKRYSSGSVGPQTEETLRNYIRRQDISGQTKLLTCYVILRALARRGGHLYLGRLLYIHMVDQTVPARESYALLRERLLRRERSRDERIENAIAAGSIGALKEKKARAINRDYRAIQRTKGVNDSRTWKALRGMEKAASRAYMDEGLYLSAARIERKRISWPDDDIHVRIAGIKLIKAMKRYASDYRTRRLLTSCAEGSIGISSVLASTSMLYLHSLNIPVSREDLIMLSTLPLVVGAVIGLVYEEALHLSGEKRPILHEFIASRYRRFRDSGKEIDAAVT